VLLPERLGGNSLQQVQRLQITVGTRRESLADVFYIEGEPGDDLRISASHTRLTRVGAGMTRGTLHVEGDVGAMAGANMRGGQLSIAGNAGDYLAAGMTAGELLIEGNAGEFAAGALPAERYGLRGGIVVVKGDASDRLADRMRRGTLIVAGKAGDFAASRMIAGTVAIGGGVGSQIAIGMRRGTLLLGNDANPLQINDLIGEALTKDTNSKFRFVDGGPLSTVYARLLSTSLNGAAGHTTWLRGPTRRLVGDRLVDGQGEILVAG
jgi:formylmethanofuran dehydrogenase subunit C